MPTARRVAFVVTMLFLAIHLSAQTNSELYAFKDNKLGMSAEDFKALHRTPGHWERNKMPRLDATDPNVPPAGANWEWMPEMKCKERYKGVTICEYDDTITEIQARATAILVDDKLSALNVLVVNAPFDSPNRVGQALTAKFGSPQDSQVTFMAGATRQMLRWDNSVSMVDFENAPCNQTLSPSEGIAELLKGDYCRNPDTYITTISVWYIHKALSQRMLLLNKEAKESTEKKARSDL